MTQYFIQTTNSSFISCDEGADYDDLTDARIAALKAASDVACSEISLSKIGTVVEVVVRTATGQAVAKFAVAMSVGELLLSDGS